MSEDISPLAPRQERAWLDHLELLANLPYPAAALIPTVLATLRRGFDADIGSFGWVAGPHLEPVAFWSERLTEPVFRWFNAHLDEVFAEFPLRQQLESDGAVVRQIQSMPGYEDHWHHRQLLEPLGVRWAMAVPVFDRQGACDGFLYLFRRAAAGPYTDGDQARLRRARERLRGLGAAVDSTLPPCPLRPARVATLQFDATGRLLARGQGAIELLYLCHDSRMGILDWAAPDQSALPAQARAMVGALLADTTSPAVVQCDENRAAGCFRFRAERLHALDGGPCQIAVTISHWEPIDLTVARALLDWPLSPQEKRLIVLSTRRPDQRQLAEALGITVATLKSYINRLHARLAIPSRQALIDRLLAESVAA